jgi:hypothetical protein
MAPKGRLTGQPSVLYCYLLFTDEPARLFILAQLRRNELGWNICRKNTNILLWNIVDIKVDANDVEAILSKLAEFQTPAFREDEPTFLSGVPSLEYPERKIR